MNTPTINVNLKPCGCGLADRAPTYPLTPHQDHCPAKPVLIPCPLQGTVTFEVVLGECDKRCATWAAASAPYGKAPDGTHHVHHDRCPARPIRVTVAISGGSWEGSDVDEGEPIVHGLVGRLQNDKRKAINAACRDRWALVKALVTGEPLGRREADCVSDGIAIVELFSQRDAVFAALAKRSHAEDAGDEALAEFLAAGIPPSLQVTVGRKVEQRISEIALAAYVAHVIEQVGNLEGVE